MTKEKFEAYKANQIAALLEWERKRRQVAELIRTRIVESTPEHDTLPVTSRNVTRDDQ